MSSHKFIGRFHNGSANVVCAHIFLDPIIDDNKVFCENDEEIDNILKRRHIEKENKWLYDLMSGCSSFTTYQNKFIIENFVNPQSIKSLTSMLEYLKSKDFEVNFKTPFGNSHAFILEIKPIIKIQEELNKKENLIKKLQLSNKIIKNQLINNSDSYNEDIEELEETIEGKDILINKQNKYIEYLESTIKNILNHNVDYIHIDYSSP